MGHGSEISNHDCPLSSEGDNEDTTKNKKEIKSREAMQ